MTKIFVGEAEKCWDCPYCGFFGSPENGGIKCVWSGTPRVIKDAKTIPSWCPLPDKKGG